MGITPFIDARDGANLVGLGPEQSATLRAAGHVHGDDQPAQRDVRDADRLGRFLRQTTGTDLGVVPRN